MESPGCEPALQYAHERNQTLLLQGCQIELQNQVEELDGVFQCKPSGNEDRDFIENFKASQVSVRQPDQEH